MISSLRGEVAHIGSDSLVLDVHGVGYHVLATPQTLGELRLGQDVQISTSLVIREDSMTLFGFLGTDERDMYETLQTVSGVGPKLALALLAVHSPDELRRAVADEDVKALQLVSGVGPKSAKRLVLELQGKLGAPSPAAAPSRGRTDPAQSDVLTALVGLGWQQKVAADALARVVEQAPDDADTAALLRATLAELGGKTSG